MTTVETNIMKISKETLDILKNYSTINSNIIIPEGNEIATLSPMKNIMSLATVTETFENEIAIWDLNKFLGTISLYENPIFEFNEDHVIISEENGKTRTKYRYAESQLIQRVTQRVKMDDVVVSFELRNKDLSQVLRAASVLQLPDLAVRTSESGDSIELVALDSKDSTCNTYSVDLGELPNDGHDFEFFFKTENMKMLPGDYNIEISKKMVCQMKNQNSDLAYWIALESNSRYEG